LVHVGFDPSVFGSPSAAATFQVVPPAQDVPALVDTGAFESCIDDQLAQQLQLPLVDQVQVSGVGGATTLNVYLAVIAIPALRSRQYGRFTGAHLAAGGQTHRVLLGRTLLKNSILIYDGHSGSVKLTR
jgi:predicted aspartyl protease